MSTDPNPHQGFDAVAFDKLAEALREKYEHALRRSNLSGDEAEADAMRFALLESLPAISAYLAVRQDPHSAAAPVGASPLLSPEGAGTCGVCGKPTTRGAECARCEAILDEQQ